MLAAQHKPPTTNNQLELIAEPLNVLDEIDSVIMGELKLREDGGEVININGWKPEIVKD